MPDDNQITSTPPFAATDGCALFVGGPRDGQRIMVRPLPIIHTPDKVGNLYVESVYHRQCIRAGSMTFVIYLHERMTMEMAMQALLDGYGHNDKLCREQGGKD